MKLFQAIPLAEFAAKAFSAAGLDFEKLAKAGDTSCLKTHVDQTVAIAIADHKIDESALDEAIAANAELETKLSAASAVANRYTAASAVLAAAGVKFDFASFDAAKPETFKAALDARVSTQARELVARTGGPIIDETPSRDAAADTKPAARRELTLEAFNALTPAERLKFSQSGGRITDMPIK